MKIYLIILLHIVFFTRHACSQKPPYSHFVELDVGHNLVAFTQGLRYNVNRYSTIGFTHFHHSPRGIPVNGRGIMLEWNIHNYYTPELDKIGRWYLSNGILYGRRNDDLRKSQAISFILSIGRYFHVVKNGGIRLQASGGKALWEQNDSYGYTSGIFTNHRLPDIWIYGFDISLFYRFRLGKQ